MTSLEGWTEGQLGSICSIEIGGTPSRNVAEFWDTARETDNAWVSIKDMRQRVITETTENITDMGVKHSNAKLQDLGTVLLSLKLTIGRMAVAGIPLYTNEAIAGLRPTGLARDYLYHGLQHWDLLQGVDQAIKGATLNKEKLKRITFEYPECKPEQAKIAEVFSTVDRAIEQTEALIAKQQRIKSGLMQDLLTRGIDEHGNLRSEETHEFKDSPLGLIPVEWNVKKLSELAEVKGGKRLSAGHNYTEVDAGLRYLRVLDFYEREIEYHKLVSLEERTFKALGRYEIEKGQLSVSIAGSLGYFAVFSPPSGIRAILTENAARIIPSGFVVPEYLCAVLNSIVVQTQIEAEKGTGGGVPKLALFRIQSLLVPLPQEELEQQRILEKLQANRIVTTSYMKTLKKLRSLKTALMQDLLTGEVRVTPLLNDKEDASL